MSGEEEGEAPQLNTNPSIDPMPFAGRRRKKERRHGRKLEEEEKVGGWMGGWGEATPHPGRREIFLG